MGEKQMRIKGGRSYQVQKTRKEHKCSICGDIIPVGSMAFWTGKKEYRHALRDATKCNEARERNIQALIARNRRERIEG